MVQKKNKLSRQKLAVNHLELSIGQYQEMLKNLEIKTDEHKKIALKLKLAQETLENTLNNMKS
jgi:hypothetical protein